MHSTRGGDGWAMLGWWGWRNVSLLGSKQDGEELRKTMGGEHPTMGKAKGQLSPSVTLCFTVPMVVSKAERDGQPWGQHGVRGPCLHKSPPPPTAWSCPGAWPNLHTKDDGLLPALCNFVLAPQGDASPPSPLVGCTRAGWVPSSEGLEMGCLWVHLAPLIPRLWEAFCACHLSHVSREHLC